MLLKERMKTVAGKAQNKRRENVEKALQKFGADSIQKLADIGDDEETPPKLRADIWRWFAEMEFGKPTAAKDREENIEDDVLFQGEMEEWSR